MMMLRAALAASLALGLLASPSAGEAQVTDTADARRDAALKYLASVPIDTLLDDMTNEFAKQIPAARRDEFVRLMKKVIPLDRIKALTVDAMVRHFTVPEIEAMTKFYSSVEGKAVMRKSGVYMGEMLPRIQAEVLQALQKVRVEMQI